jgi:hypothetical protein
MTEPKQNRIHPRRTPMGWSSGVELAEKVWEIVKKEIPQYERARIARELVSAWLDMDCDNIDEAEDLYKESGYEFELLLEESEFNGESVSCKRCVFAYFACKLEECTHGESELFRDCQTGCIGIDEYKKYEKEFWDRMERKHNG